MQGSGLDGVWVRALRVNVKLGGMPSWVPHRVVGQQLVSVVVAAHFQCTAPSPAQRRQALVDVAGLLEVLALRAAAAVRAAADAFAACDASSTSRCKKQCFPAC